ncbi:hypothetical protein GGR57DRAFT_510672 [Xylariaceae sp. FL1272]|nr:hypothetical protein GGR57DRAFT_510672 [Xylariaceae sp. FL1272]
MPAQRPAQKASATSVMRKSRARVSQNADGSGTSSRKGKKLIAAAAARRARRKFDEFGEKPTNPLDWYYIMEITQTRKRSASGAWDDNHKPPKKSKTDLKVDEEETSDQIKQKKKAAAKEKKAAPKETEKVLPQEKKKGSQDEHSQNKASQNKSPEGKKKSTKRKKRSLPAKNWQNDPSLEQPRSPTDLPVVLHPAGSTNDPAKNLGLFGRLPPEIRDEILRKLLVWPRNILVFRGWSITYPRQRISLPVAILRTCRMLMDQGLRILFGENTFEYDLRDPKNGHSHTMPVIDKVFDKSHIKINDVGHLIRSIKIKVHRNRLGEAEQRQDFERAVFKFLPGGGLKQPANLQTLTLEVPAETMQDLRLPTWREDPFMVPVAQMLNKHDKRIATGLRDLNVRYIRILARRHDDHKKPQPAPNCYEGFIDCEYLRHFQAQRKTDKSGDHLSKDVGAVQKRYEREVRKARSRIMNIGWRIEALAWDPKKAMKEGLWRPIYIPTGRQTHITFETSAPRSDRSSATPCVGSSITNKGYMAKRTSVPEYDLDPEDTVGSQSTTLRDKFVVKLKYTPGKYASQVRALANTAESSTSPASLVLNVGNAANDARLLKAQQGGEEDKNSSEQGGMLTAGFLEDNTEQGSVTIKTKGKGKEVLRHPNSRNQSLSEHDNSKS